MAKKKEDTKEVKMEVVKTEKTQEELQAEHDQEMSDAMDKEHEQDLKDEAEDKKKLDELSEEEFKKFSDGFHKYLAEQDKQYWFNLVRCGINVDGEELFMMTTKAGSRILHKPVNEKELLKVCKISDVSKARKQSNIRKPHLFNINNIDHGKTKEARRPKTKTGKKTGAKKKTTKKAKG